MVDDGVPVAIRLGLVLGSHLKRERPVVADPGPAVEAEAGIPITLNSTVSVSFLASGIVGRGPVYGTDGGVRGELA